MACERYREALSERAAGALAPAELESHLAGCEDCRQELAKLRRALALVDGELRGLLATEPSPDLAARIRQAAAEPEAGFRFRPAFVFQTLAAAAVLAAAVFVLLRGHETAPTPVAALAAHPPLASAAPPPAPGAPFGPTAPRAPTVPPGVPGLPVETSGHSRATVRRAAPPAPEVLVPPGQVETLLRLTALVNRQRLAPPGLGAAGQASPDLAEPRPIAVGSIDITPLEIVPLDPAEDSGT